MAQTYSVDFVARNKQFDWFDAVSLVLMSLVIYESDKNSTIYDNCDMEFASTYIQNIEIENLSNTYSLAN